MDISFDTVAPAIDLASDNVAGVSPEILEMMREASAGTAPSYGADLYTERLEHMLAELFETPCSVFPVSSGTAANAIALAAVTPSYRAVACSDCAHVLTSECGAPEFYSGGAKTRPVRSEGGLIDPAALADAFVEGARHGVHESRIASVSLTQATEWGTVYPAERIAAIAAVARRFGAAVHMDGARFGNAVATLGISPAEATWRAGVDMISFGATKNGAMAAEAIVVFRQGLAEGIAERRKQSGHLLSKQRFLSAQLVGYLQDGLWLRNARHANAMAKRLGDGLAAVPGCALAYPVEANEVFVRLPAAVADALERARVGFYRWSADPAGVLARMVTSFATDLEAVERVLEIGWGAAPSPAGASGPRPA